MKSAAIGRATKATFMTRRSVWRAMPEARAETAAVPRGAPGLEAARAASAEPDEPEPGQSLAALEPSLQGRFSAGAARLQGAILSARLSSVSRCDTFTSIGGGPNQTSMRSSKRWRASGVWSRSVS